MCPAWPTSGRRQEKSDRKFVTAMGEFATVTDFVAGARGFGGRKEIVNRVFAGLLFHLIGEHEDAGFFIVGLPSMKESIRGGEGDDVIVVGGGCGTASFGWREGGREKQKK